MLSKIKIGAAPTLDVLFHHEITPHTETRLYDISICYLWVRTDDPGGLSKHFGFFAKTWEITGYLLFVFALFSSFICHASSGDITPKDRNVYNCVAHDTAKPPFSP
jgi:hypothetical protein